MRDRRAAPAYPPKSPAHRPSTLLRSRALFFQSTPVSRRRENNTRGRCGRQHQSTLAGCLPKAGRGTRRRSGRLAPPAFPTRREDHLPGRRWSAGVPVRPQGGRQRPAFDADIRTHMHAVRAVIRESMLFLRVHLRPWDGWLRSRGSTGRDGLTRFGRVSAPPRGGAGPLPRLGRTYPPYFTRALSVLYSRDSDLSPVLYSHSN